VDGTNYVGFKESQGFKPKQEEDSTRTSRKAAEIAKGQEGGQKKNKVGQKHPLVAPLTRWGLIEGKNGHGLLNSKE